MIFKRIKSDGLAHIKGSYSIWLEGLPAYIGWVLTYGKPILLVLECSDHLDKAVRYLVRLGYDNIVGYPNVCCDVLVSMTAWRVSKYPMTRE